MSSPAVSDGRNSLSPWVRSRPWLTVCPERFSPHTLISFQMETALWASAKIPRSYRRSNLADIRLKPISGIFPQMARPSTHSKHILCPCAYIRHHPLLPGISGSFQLPRRNTMRHEQPRRGNHREHLLDILTQRHRPVALQHVQRASCGHARDHRRFVFKVCRGPSRRFY